MVVLGTKIYIDLRQSCIDSTKNSLIFSPCIDFKNKNIFAIYYLIFDLLCVIILRLKKVSSSKDKDLLR